MVSSDDGGAGRLVRADQVAQRVRVEQRDVAVADQDRAGGAGRHAPQAAPHGVAGAEPSLLDGGVDRAAEIVGDRGRLGGDLLPLVADDDDEVPGGQRPDRVHGVAQQAAPGDRVQHLRHGRPHPGARTGRQHDRRRGLVTVGHLDSCLSARFSGDVVSSVFTDRPSAGNPVDGDASPVPAPRRILRVPVAAVALHSTARTSALLAAAPAPITAVALPTSGVSRSARPRRPSVAALSACSRVRSPPSG